MNNQVSYIGCDMHKKYSVFVTMDQQGIVSSYERKRNDRREITDYLDTLPNNLPIAVESTGNWYWLVDLFEEAGFQPKLAHPKKSKLMMGHINKTDKLDAKGLATLLRNGTLPSIWIPPGEIRDQRELLRWRMTLSQFKIRLKNRIHATFAKYGIRLEGPSDLFGKQGRELIDQHVEHLPAETARCMKQELQMLDQTQHQMKEIEQRIKELIKESPQMQLIQTAPGIGDILSMVINMELGDIGRFHRAENLAAYSGLVPTVRASGGKTYYGKAIKQANHYLKWAFTEAANCIVSHRAKWSDKHVTRLYERIKYKKGHGKAVVAVGRHLSEAVFWMITKNEPYQEPRKNVSSTPGPARPNDAIL